MMMQSDKNLAVFSSRCVKIESLKASKVSLKLALAIRRAKVASAMNNYMISQILKQYQLKRAEKV